jgi:hypothetical protein
MKTYYKTITSISIKHDYFSDKELKNVTVHPFEATTRFFNNHRILFKTKKNNFILLQEMNVSDDTPFITNTDTELNFFFGVNFNDKYHQLRSGLNYDPRKHKMIFNLVKNHNVLVNNDSIVPVWKSNLFIGTDFFSVKNNNDVLVYSSDMNEPHWFDDLETGLYKINDYLFFKCNSCNDFDAVLILKIDQLLVDREISIPAGLYKWRYHIQSKYNSYVNLNIIDENEVYQFVQEKSEVKNHSIFISTQEIKLSEIALSSLSLYNNDISLKKHLPNPEIENARFFNEENIVFVLNAYLTI